MHLRLPPAKFGFVQHSGDGPVLMIDAWITRSITSFRLAHVSPRASMAQGIGVALSGSERHLLDALLVRGHQRNNWI